MKKLFIFISILFLFLLCSPAWAATDTHYVTQSGAGSYNGSSIDNAFRVSDFNDSGNWDTDVDDDNKIGPGDTVYLSGTISTGLVMQGDGTNGHQITIDGWEGGSCAPRTATCSSSALLSAINYIDKDYISWVDSRFIRSGTGLTIGYNAKVEYAKIERNLFDNSGGGSSSMLQSWFMVDSLINNNNFIGGAAAYQGKTFVLMGGSRNKITYNKTYDGTIGIYFKSSIQSFTANPAAENDPDFNISYNEIAYNYVESCAQEGISFDPAADDNCGIRELDTVTIINSNVVTLDNSGGEWTGESGTYVGYYMVVAENDNDVFGQHSIITGHTNNEFTLDSALTNLEVGDHVVIQLVYKRNWVHHNTLDGVGFDPSAILFDAGGLENLIEYNTQSGSDMGIKVMSLFSYCPNDGSADNITGTFATGSAAFNVVRNNTMAKVRVYALDKNYGAPEYVIDTRNNAVYDNTLVDGIDSTLAFTYYDNNILGIEQDGCAPGCVLSVDPTVSLTGFPFDSNTYYVTQSGAGSHNGAAIGDAWSVAEFNALTGTGYADDTFYFSGTITTQVDVNVSGTSGNVVTLDGYETDNTTYMDLSEVAGRALIDTNDNGYGILIDNSDYITAVDFEITDCEGAGISICGASHDILIKRTYIYEMDNGIISYEFAYNVTIGGSSGHGNVLKNLGSGTDDEDIALYDTNDIIISYNHLYANDPNNWGIDGIVVVSTTHDVLIEYNSIHDHEYTGHQHGEDGIDLKSMDTYNFIIRYNNIYNHHYQNCVKPQSGSHHVYIYCNRCAVSENGINWGDDDAGDDIYVFSNLVFDAEAHGIHVGYQGSAGDNSYVFNNTIVENGNCTEAGDTGDCEAKDANTTSWGNLAVMSATSGVIIKNNILYKGRPNDNNYSNLYVTKGMDELTTADYNHYYWPSHTSTMDWGDFGSTNLAGLQGGGTHGLPQEAGGSEDDPLFNTGVGVFTLQSTSPCIGGGVDMGTGNITTLTIQGVGYPVPWAAALDPILTDWSTTPPTVHTLNQDMQGSAWEQGAYVYVGEPPPSAELTGTMADPGLTEAEVVAGGANATLYIDLSNTEWESTPLAVGDDNALTDALIAGLLSDKDGGDEAAGWLIQVNGNMTHAEVTRTSATRVTIELTTYPNYAIDANEAITVTVPDSCITSDDGSVTATPTFTVYYADPPIVTVGISGTMADGEVTEAEMVAGGASTVLTITLTNSEFEPNCGDGTHALSQTLVDAMLSDGAEPAGWDAVVTAELSVSATVAVSTVISNRDTITISYPDFDGDPNTLYSIDVDETITVNVPDACITANYLATDPTFTISAGAVVPIATLLGTAVEGGTLESLIISGDQTIDITLTGSTFDANCGRGDDTRTDELINGLTSAGSETLGWNNLVKAALLADFTKVDTQSDTFCRITLPAISTYLIEANEEVELTIHDDCVGNDLTNPATPKFTVVNDVSYVPLGNNKFKYSTFAEFNFEKDAFTTDSSDETNTLSVGGAADNDFADGEYMEGLCSANFTAANTDYYYRINANWTGPPKAGDPISMGTWVRFKSDHDGAIFTKYNNDLNTNKSLIFRLTTVGPPCFNMLLSFNSGASAEEHTHGTTLTVDGSKWYFVAFSFDGTSYDYAIRVRDGNFAVVGTDLTGTATLDVNGLNLGEANYQIGCYTWGGVPIGLLNANLDGMVIQNRFWSAADVTNLAEGDYKWYDVPISAQGLKSVSSNITSTGIMEWAMGWVREPYIGGEGFTYTVTHDWPLSDPMTGSETMLSVTKWNDQTGWSNVYTPGNIWKKTTYIEPIVVHGDLPLSVGTRQTENDGNYATLSSGEWDWYANALYVNVDGDPSGSRVTPSPWEVYCNMSVVAGHRQDSFGDAQISDNITLPTGVTIKDALGNDAVVIGALADLKTYPTNSVAIAGCFVLGPGGDYPLWADGSTGFTDLLYELDEDRIVILPITDDISTTADNMTIRGTGGSSSITGSLTHAAGSDDNVVRCMTFSGGITDNGADNIYLQNCRGGVIE